MLVGKTFSQKVAANQSHRCVMNYKLTVMLISYQTCSQAHLLESEPESQFLENATAQVYVILQSSTNMF